jgi:ribosomal protein S18 acetylase RimI-like enzyme
MTLGTRESYRGRGIANRLLDALMQRLALQYGALSFSLHCTTDNAAAIALYTKKMFVVARQLDAHYHFHGKHHDALELVRESNKGKSCSCRVM